MPVNATIINEFLKSEFGYDPDVRKPVDALVPFWKQYRDAKVAGFHSYTEYNGRKKVTRQRLSLNMAARVSRDKADIMFNQGVKISLKDAKSNEELKKLLDSMDFYASVSEIIDGAYWSGTNAIIPAVVFDTGGNGRLVFDGISAMGIYPITYDRSSGITEAAFSYLTTRRGETVLCLSVHMVEGGVYIIRNYEADKRGQFEQTGEDFNTGSYKKTFSIFHTLDRIDWYSPFYKSVYADCTPSLKALDSAFSEGYNDIIAARRRVLRSIDTMDVDEHGEPIVYDDEGIFYYIVDSKDKSKDLFQEVISDLRVSQYWEEIKNNMANIGNSCGMPDFYDPLGIRVSNVSYETMELNMSKTNIRRDSEWNQFEKAIYDLIDVTIHLYNTFCGGFISPDGLAIAQNTDPFKSNAQTLKNSKEKLSMGIISKAEARAAVEGEDLETAKAKIAEIQGNSPAEPVSV